MRIREYKKSVRAEGNKFHHTFQLLFWMVRSIFSRSVLEKDSFCYVSEAAAP